MIRSMTGFGEAEGSLIGRPLLVQLRSVNHRYLDLRCKLPSALLPFETKITAVAREHLSRGKVDLLVTLGRFLGTGEVEGLVVDEVLARTYWERGCALAASLGQPAPVFDLGLLLGLPDVIRLEEPRRLEADTVWPALEVTLREALAALVEARTSEGDMLRGDLAARIETLQTGLGRARERVPEVRAHHVEGLQERLGRLLERLADERAATRIAQEVALLVDRLDVEEEMTRLDHHLTTLADLLRQPGEGPHGRRIDFIIQEAMREVNTLGSKANDAEVADVVLAMKAELERVREQVQNIE